MCVYILIYIYIYIYMYLSLSLYIYIYICIYILYILYPSHVQCFIGSMIMLNCFLIGLEVGACT